MKPADLFDLSGRVVILTGGAGFLGTEFTRTLAQAGARVVIADIAGDVARSLAEEITRTTDSEALGIQTDVTDPASVSAMVDRAMGEYGRIDALVNNAALDPKFDPGETGKHQQTFEGFLLEQWEESLRVGLTGAFLCAQAVTPIFQEQNRGVIVNVSSMYGLVGPDQRLYEKDDPKTPHGYKPPIYSVEKAGLHGLTKYLATWFAGANVRVNTLTLGGVFKGHDEQFLKRYAARAPLGRMMKLEEIGGPLLFLLSDASSYMTGANLVVDGGWTAW